MTLVILNLNRRPIGELGRPMDPQTACWESGLCTSGGSYFFPIPHQSGFPMITTQEPHPDDTIIVPTSPIVPVSSTPTSTTPAPSTTSSGATKPPTSPIGDPPAIDDDDNLSILGWEISEGTAALLGLGLGGVILILALSRR